MGFSNQILVAGPFKGVWPALRAEAQPREQRLLGTDAEEVRRGWEGESDATGEERRTHALVVSVAGGWNPPTFADPQHIQLSA